MKGSWPRLRGCSCRRGVPCSIRPPRFTLIGWLSRGMSAWFMSRRCEDQIVALRPGESIGPYRLTKILADRATAGPQALSVMARRVQGPAQSPRGSKPPPSQATPRA